MRISKIASKIMALLMAAVPVLVSGQVGFVGNQKPVWKETTPNTTGLDNIYVAHDSHGLEITYTAASASENVVWYGFDHRGGSSVEEIQGVTKTGNVTTLSQPIMEHGYMIEEGTRRTYFWLIDYESKRYYVNSLSLAPEQDCGQARLIVDGNGSNIIYYTINGMPQTLSRQIRLSYKTLSWADAIIEDPGENMWMPVDVEVELDGFQKDIVQPGPLCNTDFFLSGDRFLEFWGEAQEPLSVNLDTKSVDVRTFATQAVKEGEEKKEAGLGGSAPVEIKFAAYPTDAVIHNEWQMARDPEFNDIVLRLNNESHTETFDESGTTYWRFIGSDASGDCEAYGETFKVDIGESMLDCPNAFSPGASEGVNDVWKVSSKSLVEFHCWIFNRYGVKMFEFSDPSQGWDGMRGGKVVPSGVYYYVIEARGADGRTYKKSGDINIVGQSSNYKGGGTGEGGETNP